MGSGGVCFFSDVVFVIVQGLNERKGDDFNGNEEKGERDLPDRLEFVLAWTPTACGEEASAGFDLGVFQLRTNTHKIKNLLELEKIVQDHQPVTSAVSDRHIVRNAHMIYDFCQQFIRYPRDRESAYNERKGPSSQSVKNLH